MKNIIIGLLALAVVSCGGRVKTSPIPWEKSPELKEKYGTICSEGTKWARNVLSWRLTQSENMINGTRYELREPSYPSVVGGILWVSNSAGRTVPAIMTIQLTGKDNKEDGIVLADYYIFRDLELYGNRGNEEALLKKATGEYFCVWPTKR